MKNIKHKLVIISLGIIFSSLLLAMDRPEKKLSKREKMLQNLQRPLKYMNEVIASVTSKVVKPTQINWNEIFDFVSLPKEIKEKIIEYLIEYSNANDYKKAIKPIINLALVSKDIYNKTFHDIRFCYNIIKNISSSFAIANSIVCREFQLQPFQYIYDTQSKLLSICRNTEETAFHELNLLLTANPSLDFTFTYTNSSPLLECVLHLNIPILQQILYHTERNGSMQNLDIMRSLTQIIYASDLAKTDNSQQTQQNQQKNLEIVKLLLPVLKKITPPDLFLGELSSLLVAAIDQIKFPVIQLLLEAGADPRVISSREIGYPRIAKTPLTIAENKPKILEMLNKAVKRLDEAKISKLDAPKK